MKYLVVAVRDAVSSEFTNISLEISEASAYRSFASAVTSSQARETGLFFTDPDDFSLWLIGEFDSETGEIYSVNNLRICEAGEV